LFFTEETGFPKYFGAPPSNLKELSNLNKHYADIAASIQKVTEDILVGMAKHLHKTTGLSNLCMAGGVALNCVANTRILHESGFEKLYVQPAAGDGGGALGAALWAYNTLLGKPRNFQMDHAFWGRANSDFEIGDFLVKNNIKHTRYDDEDKMLDAVVNHLTNASVIGWAQGRFEWGPRALGSRSILADPRNPNMKDIVNTKIKFREPYRPFAPSVLAESAEKYFDLPNAAKHAPARYMQYVVPVKPEAQSILPAITHVDGTGRMQTVFKDQSPRYYKMIEKFGQATGVPVVMNTSFNLKGEPIVNTPANAFNTFSKSEMDALVLENFIIEKN
jgi:carbamoyltransferase